MASASYAGVGGDLSTTELLLIVGIGAAIIYGVGKGTEGAADKLTNNPLTQGAGATIGLPAKIWGDFFPWATGEIDQFEGWLGEYL